jgi:hypothetical protein
MAGARKDHERMKTLLTSLVLIAAAVTGMAAPATAEPAGGEPSATAIALAKRYVADAEARKILEDEGPTVARYMISKVPAPAGGEAKASEVKQAMLDAANAAVHAKVPEFLDKTAVIYARVFTEKELADIVAFYDSPSGKAFVAKTGAAAEPMAELIRSLGDDIQRDTGKRFCAKEPDSCKAADAKAP